MKLSHTLATLAAVAALATSATADVLYSWDSGLDGWSLNSGYSYTNSTTVGVTEGTGSLQITAPIGDMWWAPLSIGLDATQRTQVFSGTTGFSVDMTYLNPGYTSWYNPASVSLFVQGDGVSWTSLGSVEVPVGVTTPTHATFSIDSATANQLATGTWAQMFLAFTYGNDDSTGVVRPASVNINVDNFSNITAIPEPSTYAAIGGVIALGAALIRRRRR